MKYKPSYCDALNGFTLVELSIVLVILGLLVGGVLTGQTLIRAAELRTITTQQARYITAVQTFRDKYFAIPGDMTNAQAYWGIAHATLATCIFTASTDSKTCNGDGNGIIDVSAGANERFRFWQHLANAGLIEGSYSGMVLYGGDIATTTANAPSGRISSSLWYVSNFIFSNGGIAFDGRYGNSFEFDGMTNFGDPSTPILKPEEAYNIDSKIDDGKPATGKVVIRATTLNSCTDTASTSNFAASYLLTNQSLTCGLFFRDAF